MNKYKEFYVGQKIKGVSGSYKFTGIIRFIYEEFGRIKVDVERSDREQGSGKNYNNKSTWTTTQYRELAGGWKKEKDVSFSYNLVPVIKYKTVIIDGENYV